MQKLLTILIILTAFTILGVTLFNAYKHRPVEENEPTSEVEVGVVDEQRLQPKLPRQPRNNPKTGIASWYGKEVCGQRIYGETCKTASGEIFDENALTLAHRTLPFGTLIQFGYGDRGVTCRVNDRGPFISGREFDLSRGCFSQLAELSKGIIKVEWRVGD